MRYPSFWDTLSQPIIGLAPMDGVTDAPCRTMHRLYGRPDVVLTEFTNVEGLWRGSARIFRDFLYTPAERPVVAQIFGCRPEYFFDILPMAEARDSPSHERELPASSKIA